MSVPQDGHKTDAAQGGGGIETRALHLGPLTDQAELDGERIARLMLRFHRGDR